MEHGSKFRDSGPIIRLLTPREATRGYPNWNTEYMLEIGVLKEGYLRVARLSLFVTIPSKITGKMTTN